MKTRRMIITAGLAAVAFWVAIDFMLPVEAFVVRQNDRVYLVDRTGERWDITQAVSIGFDPEKFEFGIGRHAFQPLSDEDWQVRGDAGSKNIRIIGISRNGSAHAYAVSRLAYHETANTTLAGKPIVAGY